MYGVSIIVVQNEKLSVAGAAGEDETACLVAENLSCRLHGGNVTVVGSD